MLCPYIRSSSLGTYKSCQMRYYFEYMLGMKVPTGKAACMGTMFHKTFEVRAAAKKAIQEGLSFIEDDNFGRLSIDDCRNYELIHKKSFDYYSEIESHLKFAKKDYDDILRWITTTLEKYPDYDPLNLNIVAAELYFDIEIKKDWAKYEGLINGEKITGNLHIKGTMDSVIKHSDSVYELCDFKTGMYRTDFATGQEKDLEYLKNDTQLLLYLIALKTIYPDVDFILSLFYINKGGIFSVPGDADMLDRAWKMLEKSFKEISKNYNPVQLDPSHKDFRCKYLCPFAKPSLEDPNVSICNLMKKRISKEGFIKVTGEKIDASKFGAYGSGGGRKDLNK